MIPLPIFITTWQDIIGEGIINAFGGGLGLVLLAVFVIAVFVLLIIFLGGAGLGLFFVIMAALLLVMSVPGAPLPMWMGFLVILAIGGLVAMAILHFIRR